MSAWMWAGVILNSLIFILIILMGIKWMKAYYIFHDEYTKAYKIFIVTFCFLLGAIILPSILVGGTILLYFISDNKYAYENNILAIVPVLMLVCIITFYSEYRSMKPNLSEQENESLAA